MIAARGLLVLCVAALVAGCASSEKRGDVGTIQSLEGRRVEIDRDQTVKATREQVIESYRAFVDTAPRDPLRPEAMRRLGDLELEAAEAAKLLAAERAAAEPKSRAKLKPPTPKGGDYQAAIKRYRDLLRAYPNYAGNDRVLYQLAHAYEVTGDLDSALQALDLLVARYPQTPHRGEAQFRRGELLFTLKDYGKAEHAYAALVKLGEGGEFYERALYMHGWSEFKQLRYDDALRSFFGVIDRKLIGRDGGEPLEKIPGLARADRELLEDSFRVVSLSLASLDGPKSIPRYFTDPVRQRYEFRVYEALGSLYFKQERVKDAADTYNSFARRYPTHPKAPLVQEKVIDAYTQAGFATLALETKREFVTRYGVASEFRKANNDAAYAPVQPLVHKHLEELARHYHAAAQKEKKPELYDQAANWYREFLISFPADAKAPEMNFLLAELLNESRHYAQAAEEYEKTAYRYPRHAKSADAGYAALLAHRQEQSRAKGEQLRVVRGRAVESALRFADTFPQDARVAAVLTDTAERLYAGHSPQAAVVVAQRVTEMKPPPAPEYRRTAWTVIAHAEFEKGGFARAEKGYSEVLALTPDKDAQRSALIERLALSVYKQGEQARAIGEHRAAVGHFLRVGKIVPNSPVRVTAEYDAAAALIAAKDWPAATKILEHFRGAYPNHKLQAEVSSKLAVVYLENGEHGKAAAELERISLHNKDQNMSREALWQAGELYEKAKRPKDAAGVYARYLERFPLPLEQAMEARFWLANWSQKQGERAREHGWLNEIVKADQAGGGARTDRTRFLAASAMMRLAEPSYDAYREVKLVEPLKQSLKNKKDRMHVALKAYERAAQYGVAEVATAATYRVAEIYHDFGKALLNSQRPKNLKGEELEQYNVLLEEQAYPFEEKSIELHEANVRRARDGIYDDWVKKSFTALGKLRPVRYGKTERGETVIYALR